MKFNILITATIVSTGILLSAVATPAFAQGRGGNSGGGNSGGGNSGGSNSGGGNSVGSNLGGGNSVGSNSGGGNSGGGNSGGGNLGGGNSGGGNSGGGNSGGGNSGGGNSGGGSSVASACPNVAGTPLCLGAFSGNDTGAQGTALTNLSSLTGFSNWTLAGKSDDGFGTFLSGGHGSQEGVWNTGLSGAGAFSVKAGTGYLLFQTNDISRINWSTLGLVNNGGQTPGLSHLSVFQKEVPEPLTLLGSGLALGFGGYFHRKRNANKSA